MYDSRDIAFDIDGRRNANAAVSAPAQYTTLRTVADPDGTLWIRISIRENDAQTKALLSDAAEAHPGSTTATSTASSISDAERLATRKRIATQPILTRTNVFLLHPPRSNLLFISVLKRAHQSSLMQALTSAFECERLIDTHLVGSSIRTSKLLIVSLSRSLVLVLLDSKFEGTDTREGRSRHLPNRSVSQATRQSLGTCSQAPEARYLSWLDGGILLATCSRSPCAAAAKEQDAAAAARAVPAAPEGVIEEDLALKRDTAHLVASTFGAEPMPVLPRVEFEVHTAFDPTAEQQASVASSEVWPFTMRVRFEGPNVIQGLRGLAQAGLTTRALPAALYNLPSAGSCSFIMQADGSVQARAAVDANPPLAAIVE